MNTFEQDACLSKAIEELEALGAPGALGVLEGPTTPLKLVRDERGLALTDGKMDVRGDFSHMVKRLTQRNLAHELLVRAVKVKGADPLRAVDATAGLGEDALLLAAAGFSVALYERNPIIAALLQDALDRAAASGVPALEKAVSNMHLICADSVQALPHLDYRPAVVLLDPMFPDKRKNSAAKKKLQLLQKLEQPCDDERALLDAALAAHPRKVVIKRPVKGPHLAGRAPDYTLMGKAIRYDVIVPPPSATFPD